jgi:hypothetical protein
VEWEAPHLHRHRSRSYSWSCTKVGTATDVWA